ncbi:MAG: hypothetical protein J6U53_05080 [Tidjanibacter sp.]|nr:hypothetical protein [Tidjanibacter sp.]
MKKFLLMVVVVALGVVQLFANEPQTTEYKTYKEMSLGERFLSWKTPTLERRFEIRLAMPLYDLNHLHRLTNGYGSAYANMEIMEIYPNSTLQNQYLVNAFKSGSVHWGYLPELNVMMSYGDNWQVGVTTCFAWANQNRYSALTGDVVQHSNAKVLVLSPMLRYNLINNNWLRLYVQAGCFGLISNQTGYGTWYEAEFFGGYGIAVGGKIYYFAETNYGVNVTYAHSFGIGYRF